MTLEIIRWKDVRNLFNATVLTVAIFLIANIMWKLDLSAWFEYFSALIPEDYVTFFFAVMILRIMDTITARVAIQRERRMFLFENPGCEKDAPKWLSHTFTEKLLIKMGMYVGILGCGWFAFRIGMGSWGMTWGMIACLYAEILSIYENTVRGGMKWPPVFKVAVSAVSALFTKAVNKLKSGKD